VILAPSTTWMPAACGRPPSSRSRHLLIYFQPMARGLGAGYAKGAAVSVGTRCGRTASPGQSRRRLCHAHTHLGCGGCTDPVLRLFDGTYYLFYTSNSATRTASALDEPEGPGRSTASRIGSGLGRGRLADVSNRILTLPSGAYVKSLPPTRQPRLGFRARYYNSPATSKWAGFMNGTGLPGLLVQASTLNLFYDLHLSAYAVRLHYGGPRGTSGSSTSTRTPGCRPRRAACSRQRHDPQRLDHRARPCRDGPLPVGSKLQRWDQPFTVGRLPAELRGAGTASSVGTEQLTVRGGRVTGPHAVRSGMPTPFSSRTTLEFSLHAWRGRAQVFGVEGRLGARCPGQPGKRVSTGLRGRPRRCGHGLPAGCTSPG